MIIFLHWSMILVTLLNWDWVTLWIGLSRSSTHYSSIVNELLVWCMLLKKKKTWKWECGLGPRLIKNCTSLSILIKYYTRVYKLMGNDELLTWMHLYNCIGYTFPFSSITHKHNIPNKFHNDEVKKVVTPHSYKLNFLTPHF